MAEERGVDAVSMRSLASELGVEAMSLYSHVSSKEQLLGAMAAHVVNTVPTPSPRARPEVRLRQLALDMRAASQKFPQVFPLVVLKPLELVASIRPTEIALQAFVDAGFDNRRAIGAQRIFLSFVRGYLLWELGGFAAGRSRGPDGTVRPSVVAEVEALDAARFPQTKRLAQTFFKILPEQQYEDGLNCVLHSLMSKARRRAR
jgi:AcrR family transcriptional regulator